MEPTSTDDHNLKVAAVTSTWLHGEVWNSHMDHLKGSDTTCFMIQLCELKAFTNSPICVVLTVISGMSTWVHEFHSPKGTALVYCYSALKWCGPLWGSGFVLISLPSFVEWGGGREVLSREECRIHHLLRRMSERKSIIEKCRNCVKSAQPLVWINFMWNIHMRAFHISR